MRIYLGTDHRGYSIKEALKIFLVEKGYEVEDMGAHTFDPDDDYPDFVLPVAQAVSQNPDEARGIIFGHSGEGEAMAANRVAGVRAAVWYGGPEDIVTLSRKHNNANILSIGAGFVDEPTVQRMVQKWLKTDFSREERHQRRIEKIEKTLH